MVVDQLKSSLSCPSYVVKKAVENNTSKGNNCPAAVGNAILNMYEEMQELVKGGLNENQVEFPERKGENKGCPQCGEHLVNEGGCVVCKSCGWSRCG